MTTIQYDSAQEDWHNHGAAWLAHVTLSLLESVWRADAMPTTMQLAARNSSETLHYTVYCRLTVQKIRLNNFLWPAVPKTFRQYLASWGGVYLDRMCALPSTLLYCYTFDTAQCSGVASVLSRLAADHLHGCNCRCTGGHYCECIIPHWHGSCEYAEPADAACPYHGRSSVSHQAV